MRLAGWVVVQASTAVACQIAGGGIVGVTFAIYAIGTTANRRAH